MRVIVVGQGAAFSTFDIYYNYLTAFKEVLGETEAQGFATHTLLAYHTHAARVMNEETVIQMDDSFATIAARAARDLLLDIITFEPDVVFFISGDWMPQKLYGWVRRIRRQLNRNFLIASYITEAPYVNDVVDKYSDFFDVLFTNDKYDAERRNPNGDKFVFHLPHSYSRMTHYPFEVASKYKKDLFFVGTMFPNRLNLFSKLDFEGIDTLMYLPQISDLEHLLEPEAMEWFQLSLESGLAIPTSLPNVEVANYYRGSKISLNIHRTTGWTKSMDKFFDISNEDAYSYNPRINEIIACGGFPLTDRRQEIVDEYGDSVAIFEGAEDLNNKIRYYLEHDDIRENMKTEAQKRLTGKSYTERVEKMTEYFREALNIMETNNG